MKVHRNGIAVLAGTLALFSVGAAQTISNFSLTHGGWVYNERNLTAADGTGSDGGSADFINPFGVDNLYQNWWWYGTDANGRELALHNQVSGVQTSASSARLVYIEDAGPNSPGALQFDLEYTLTALPGGNSAIVQIGWKIHNLSNTEQHLHFFSYSDFDLNATSGNDSGTFIAPNQFALSDANPAVFGGLVASVSRLNGWEQAGFASLRNKLTNGTIDTLANATSPLSGDLTNGFSWDITLGANGSPNGGDQMVGSLVKYVNNPVPEPATLAVFAIAGVGFLARRRRK